FPRPSRSRLSSSLPWPSSFQRELLERVTAGGREPAAHRERPRDLAHVDVALRIDRDAVRRHEAPGRTCVLTAPAAQHAAFPVVDADAAVARLRDRAVTLRLLTLVPPELRDVRAPGAVEHDMRRTLRVRPFRQVLAVRAED